MINKLDEYIIKKYGIIYTPENLVNNILDLIPSNEFNNPNNKWLDIGAGEGAFSINLYNRLDKGLMNIIINENERNNHIVENMIYMAEIYPDHIKELENKFTKNANIIKKDFLSIIPEETIKFNFIIGNPPYNINGGIKTPTNKKLNKHEDGKTIYVDFINQSLKLLVNNGYLNLIIPSLWLKPDKAKLYDTLTNLNIDKLHNLSTNETFKLFNSKAQLPTSYFLIQNKKNTDKIIKIYDKFEKTYIEYKLLKNYPIPINGITIINKLLKYIKIDEISSLKYYKTNTVSKKTTLSDISNTEFKYENIKTCLLSNLTPKLIKNYSNIPEQYFNTIKLVLAHKMYGFPYLDISGIYGISTRDNYIISNKDYEIDKLKELQCFLSSKFTLFIFSTTSYRMRYLERYAFQLLPDITKIKNFPKLLNLSRESRDKMIYKFFRLSKLEINIIENNSKDYNFFLDL